ncbi:type II secretion system F family protein [Acetobacter oeni]|uniref:Type II secretion system protein GspF domain-containing protein n=1 Tax=Acetobacter oeni TaxID=304077 RepID=A0A511XIM1_9PROT|nr:type II secretion system F family protein [Acetobacter oeni]MBB3881900.1 Flp pilus assembly protein TadB [Acetobacter oeni]NHO17777.1 hypothetical protein [Acetobacter oeni]GBR02467.1 putative type II secretion system protein [Acetobacter oeni LMG 21952]GEN62793.1 hypothetical protein AOE01nite_10170 [Acetobacter oeni]
MFGLFGVECALILIALCNILAFSAFKKEKNYNRLRSERISQVTISDRVMIVEAPLNIYSKKKKTSIYYSLLNNILGVDVNSSLYKSTYVIKISSIIVFIITIISFILGYFLDRVAVESSPLVDIAIIRIYFLRIHGKYNAKLIEQLPEAVFMMSRCLKVGVSLSRTLEIVSQQAPEPTKNLFEDVVHKVAVGKELGEALEDLAGNGGIKEYRFFSIIVRLQSRTGGGLAEILESFASTIRKRTQAKKKAIALASEARTSCYVLAGLPLFMAGLMSFMNPKYIAVLYTTPSGIKMLYAAIILFVMGISSMIFITKFTLRS